MFRIRRFGIIQTANVVAVLYIVVVAIFLIPLALIVGIAGTAARPSDAGVAVGGVLAFGVIIALFYGVFGWIFTAIACALYNLVAGWVGGIQVQVEAVAPPAPPAVWAPSEPPPSPPAAPSGGA